MKRPILTLILLWAALCPTLRAQSDPQAEALIARLVQIPERQAVQAEFELTVSDGERTQTQQGSFAMQGRRFALTLEGMTIHFDGHTQWAYVEAADEVTVTEPTAEELESLNPLLLLQSYKTGYDITFATGHHKAGCHTIALRPTAAGSGEFTRLLVRLNEADGLPRFIQAEGAGGMNIAVQFNSFDTAADIPDDTFIFNPDEHEGVYVNDLR